MLGLSTHNNHSFILDQHGQIAAPRLKKISLIAYCIAAVSSASSAHGADLSGRIVGYDKAPIGNCAVSLLAAGTKTVSDAATGKFSLNGPSGIAPMAYAGHSLPQLVGSKFEFTVEGSRRLVAISVHDPKGALLASVWNGEKDPGRYAIDLSPQLSEPGDSKPRFLRVRIGEWTGSFRLILGQGRDPGRSLRGPDVPVPVLKKVAGGSVDTLSVMCPDYPAKKFPLVSYSAILGDVTVRRPNIIMFMADDLGWMDLGYQGSQYYLTPNIDRLASQSVRFPNAYAHPFCSPTRAAIMSGKEPARLKFFDPDGHLDPLPDPPIVPQTCASNFKVCQPQSTHQMELSEFTVAEALREKGYQTAFLGKWHCGKPEAYWPEHQGFDVDIGLPERPGPCSYFDPYCPVAPNLPSRKKKDYIVDRITDDALGYIDAHQAAPFFMCLWTFGVHAPFQAKDSITSKFVGKVDPRGKQSFPTMASMIYSVDESVGRLEQKLQELGLDTNTIVLFYADNGGNMYSPVQPGSPNPFPTNNFPLRMGKGNAYEGGVRVPLLVKWPGVTRAGTVDSNLVNETDFYPTFLDMAGVSTAPKQTLDGVSFAEPLRTRGKSGRKAVFCHFPMYSDAPGNIPVTWMRQGDWKLLRFYGDGPAFADRYELYDLGKDIGEANDVAALHPDIVKTMSAKIGTFLTDTKTLVPIVNPNYLP